MWYKNEIPDRINMLWEYMEQERPESQPFDHTPGSLIPLWDWYGTKIKQVPQTRKEIEYNVSRYPKWMEENVRKMTMKYTDETLSLALDTSIYLGETDIKNHPHLYLGRFVRPKRELFANRSVILKSKSKLKYFPPSQTVSVCMIRSSEKSDMVRISDLYRYLEDEFDLIKPSYWDSW